MVRIHGEHSCNIMSNDIPTARSSGGVIVTSKDGKITCDNTLDARLSLVIRDCLPTLRKIIYGDR